jgi:hypothetical protein
VQLDSEDGIQGNKETRVAKQNPDGVPQDRESIGANSTFDLFAKDQVMWSPFSAVANALLHTQRNTFAYVEANRRLVEAMRTIGRQEQNLALEISEMVLKTLFAPHLRWSSDSTSQSEDIKGAFDRGAAGIRELGAFWIDAQLRSLDVMRSHQDPPRGNTQKSAHMQVSR